MKPITVLRMKSAGATLLVSLDFKNGVYSIGGVSKTLAEACEQVLAWGTYSSSDVVGGTGLYSSSSNVYPTLTAAASAAVLAGGSFTAVVTFTVSITGTGSSFIEFDTFDATIAKAWGFAAGMNPDTASQHGQIYDFDAAFETIPLVGSGLHKAAATLSPTHLAGSIDGGTVVVTGTPQTMTLDRVGLAATTFVTVGGPAVAVIERVDFYSAVADADLVALSA